MSVCKTSLRRESGFTILETIIVVGIVGVLAVVAVPLFGNAIANFRLSGDARSVSNAISVAKMRAASDFSRVRLYVDLTGKTHHIESLDKTTTPPHWTTEGGSSYLSQGVSFSYGAVTTAPPNTQATIGMGTSASTPKCTTDAGVDIGGTACIMFNSRGVPIDTTGAPIGTDGLYLTDGSAVNAVTVAATGMVKSWRTLPVATPSWSLQ